MLRSGAAETRMGSRFGLNRDRTLWEWRIDCYQLKPQSGRNLSKIAHTLTLPRAPQIQVSRLGRLLKNYFHLSPSNREPATTPDASPSALARCRLALPSRA